MSQKYGDITDKYESIEFSLPTGNTDYDLDVNQTTFLSVFNTPGASGGINRYPTKVRVRTNNTISIKLNTTSGHSITISSTDSPFDINGIQIRNIFITNSSGSAAAIKLLFLEAYE